MTANLWMLSFSIMIMLIAILTINVVNYFLLAKLLGFVGRIIDFLRDLLRAL